MYFLVYFLYLLQIELGLNLLVLDFDNKIIYIVSLYLLLMGLVFNFIFLGAKKNDVKSEPEQAVSIEDIILESDENLVEIKEEIEQVEQPIEPKEEPIVVSEVVEEQVEETIVEEANEKEKVIETVEDVVHVEEPKLETITKEIDLSKIKYEGKLMYAPIEIKEQYSIIKNHLLAYSGVTSRISSNKETFRKSGVLAQIKLTNNKINVYLNVTPEPFIAEGYKVKNVGDSKQYEETPTHIKISNDKSIKEFVDILEVMMTSKEIKRKQRFKEINYVDYLYPNGETILNGIGLSSEYIVNSVNSKVISNDLPDDLLDYSPFIQGGELGEKVYKTTIYVDDLVDHFNDGDIITKSKLVDKKLIKENDVVVIKGRGTLDKKFIIHAEDFDSLACKMIYVTNGTIVLIKH